MCNIISALWDARAIFLLSLFSAISTDVLQKHPTQKLIALSKSSNSSFPPFIPELSPSFNKIPKQSAHYTIMTHSARDLDSPAIFHTSSVNGGPPQSSVSTYSPTVTIIPPYTVADFVLQNVQAHENAVKTSGLALLLLFIGFALGIYRRSNGVQGSEKFGNITENAANTAVSVRETVHSPSTIAENDRVLQAANFRIATLDVQIKRLKYDLDVSRKLQEESERHLDMQKQECERLEDALVQKNFELISMKATNDDLRTQIDDSTIRVQRVAAQMRESKSWAQAASADRSGPTSPVNMNEATFNERNTSLSLVSSSFPLAGRNDQDDDLQKKADILLSLADAALSEGSEDD